MGLSYSTLQACTKPCVQVSDHFSKRCLDECMCHSGCGKTCCHCHIETHHADSDFESAESENIADEREHA